MITLDKMGKEEFDAFFEASVRRQAEDRAWANGSSVATERAGLEAMIPLLLPTGMESPGHTFRVARDARGAPVGYVWFGTIPGMPEGSIMLLDIAVDERERGKGYGKEMLETMLESMGKSGYENAILNVRNDNAAAIGLYEGLGFATVEDDGKYKTMVRNLKA
jgi:ribosomal protein S18 acetylase RimI-like enzyme